MRMVMSGRTLLGLDGSKPEYDVVLYFVEGGSYGSTGFTLTMRSVASVFDTKAIA